MKYMLMLSLAALTSCATLGRKAPVVMLREMEPGGLSGLSYKKELIPRSELSAGDQDCIFKEGRNLIIVRRFDNSLVSRWCADSDFISPSHLKEIRQYY